MKALPLLVVGLLVTACSSQGERAPVSPAATLPDDGKWFCQMKPSGDSWECVQDRRLAENPKPTRLPHPVPPETPDIPPPEPSVLPDDATGADREPVPVGRPGPAAGPPPADAPRPADAPAREPPVPDGPSPPPPPIDRPAPEATSRAGAPAGDDLPEYARLAYQPAKPVPLTELPKRFYAVQLIAMSRKEALEGFVAQQGIRSVSAARVESGGELFYVLLLGIYEDRTLAERAVAAMPDVPGVQPWIRPLGSLQSAMLRADSMTGSARY